MKANFHASTKKVKDKHGCLQMLLYLVTFLISDFLVSTIGVPIVTFLPSTEY